MPKLAATTLLAATALLLPALAARAEITVTVDHDDEHAGSPAFHFKTVASPRQSAALGAAFTLVDGSRDPNGASLDVLHDNKIPDGDDEPESNFFFAGNTDGGRWLIDLGKVIPIKEVDTYSWHTDVRAPQVYKLYGSDGTAPGFVPETKRPQDPAQAGWKLLATVDTREKFAKAGGQYGVSVADPAAIVGNYRYLLFNISRTEEDDSFGNTFYSEIDVIDRDAPLNPVLASAGKETSTYDENGIHLLFSSDSPTFDPKEKDRLVKAFFIVYPEMMAMFNPNAPKSVKISIESRYHGIAATAGNTIHINPDWFRRNPEDIDVITHEGMHVVQQYRQWSPGWITEGIADYARYKFGVNNPGANWTMPDYKPGQSYTNAYRVTARFLVWLEKHVKPGIVVSLDQAMREAKYTPDFWKQQTGKSVDELWADYGKNPAL